jgi:riboflavin kinase / FMN adenylyltransferase
MPLHRNTDLTPKRFGRPVLTIGNFDGVHLGHQQVIGRAIEEARARGARSLAMTFQPHPVKVLNPSANLKLIYPYEEKIRLIEGFGVDDIVVWNFDCDLASMPAEDFVAQVLVGTLDVQKVVVGYDFNFGRGGDGNAAHLREIAAARGYDYEVERVGVYQVDGEICSSSRIREHLLRGDVARVHRLLGRPFHLRGTVVRGQGRGKTMGFPTANLSVQRELIPHDGVYLGLVRIGDGLHDALVNVGDNPTFGVNPVTVEAFILNFGEEIYANAIDVLFLDRLRDEMRFRGPDDLKTRMDKDLDEAGRFFDAFHGRVRGGR